MGRRIRVQDAVFRPEDDAKIRAAGTQVFIEANPQIHQQDDWRCRTGKCWAGWYGELSPEVEWVTERADEDRNNYVRVKATGEEVTVDAWVQDHMGINEDDADELFDGSNSRARLRAGVEAYVSGAPDVTVAGAMNAHRRSELLEDDE